MAFFVFLFGLIIGSFLNAYLWRLKEGKSVWRGRSICPACLKELSWFELIPLFSFFWQKGRCLKCQAKIDWQYPLVEFFTALLFLFAFWHNSFLLGKPIIFWLTLILDFYFLSLLIIIFVFDWRYNLIPVFPIILGTIILFFGKIFLFYLEFGFSNLNVYLFKIFLGAFVGCLFFLFQYLISQGKWLGDGDIFVGVFLGAVFGWPKIIFCLTISYILGGLAAGFLLLTKKKKLGSTLPLGIFLSLGAVLTLFFGEKIIQLYWFL